MLLEFRGRFQTDFQWSPVFDDGRDVFFALKRLGISGELTPRLTYQIDRELNVKEPWRDVFLNYRFSPALELQAGKFKLPFGLDRTISGTALDFVYRSRLGQLLAPGRDPGIVARGVVAGNRIAYDAGVFTHDGGNARVLSDPTRVFGGTTWVGRVRAHPLAGAPDALLIGVAGMVSDVPEGLPGIRGRLPVGVDFLLPSTPVKGRRVRTGLEARWEPGPWSLAGEYARVTTERLGQGASGEDLSPLLATAWYLSAAWRATGEPAATRSEPNSPAFQGGPGALELAARIEQITFASNAVPSAGPRADAVPRVTEGVLTLGFTWYLNRWSKVVGNLIRDSVGNGATSAEATWSRVLRVQLVF